jgi:chromosome segregation ATPase
MVFWVALGILLIAVIAGIAYAAIRGWQVYRTAKSTGASITSEMDRISAVTLEIEQQMAKAEAATARLNAATGRLTTSRAQLDVQLAAVREARAQVRRVFWFVPGI